MERKFVANLRVSTSSMWVTAIPLAVAFWIFLSRYPGRPFRALARRVPTLGAGLAAALVPAVLGRLVHASGALVGRVAAIVVPPSPLHPSLTPWPRPTPPTTHPPLP